MASDKIPTRLDVRSAYQGSGEGHDFISTYFEQGREFDAWLAEVKTGERIATLRDVLESVRDEETLDRRKIIAILRISIRILEDD